jgi:hypothetical protein
VGPDEYQEFLRYKAQRRSSDTAELSDAEVRAVGAPSTDARHDHLNAHLDTE